MFLFLRRTHKLRLRSRPLRPVSPLPPHSTQRQESWLTQPPKDPWRDLDPDRVVATIGTEKMTAAEFDAIIDGFAAQQYLRRRSGDRPSVNLWNNW